MKNKFLNATVLLTFAILITSCKPKAPEVTIDKEQIKQEIQGIENKMAASFNDNSVAGQEYYADDAVSFSQNKPPIVGKAAIEKSIKEDLANFPKGYVKQAIYPFTKSPFDNDLKMEEYSSR